MGFTLGIVGNYPRALEIQLKALRIAEKHNFLNGKAEVFSRLGNIYRDAGDYSKAVVFHQRARLMFDSLQNHNQSAANQNLLARDYLLMNKTDSAQYYAQLAYENVNRWKVEFMRSPNFLGMGRQQAKLGNFPLAPGWVCFCGFRSGYWQSERHPARHRKGVVNLINNAFYAVQQRERQGAA